MLLGKLAVGPGGVSVAVIAMWPLKEFWLVRVKVNVPLVPWMMFMKIGVTAIVKSGLGSTVALTVIEWMVRLPPAKLMAHSRRPKKPRADHSVSCCLADNR